MFTYRWRDSRNVLNTTKFEILQQDLRIGNAEFKKPDLTDSPRIVAELKKEASKISEALGCDIEVRPHSEGFNFAFRGCRLNDREVSSLTAHLAKVRDVASASQLKENFYVVVNSPSGDYLRPDYLTLKNRYSKFGGKVAEALATTSESSLRSLASRATEFIQSIPYSTSGTNDAGFQTPIGMFTQNRGDCDTKSVALAAILRGYGIESVMVTMPDHMFMGVEIPSRPSDHTFVYKGRRFVSVEPSGLGYPLGSLASDSLAALQSGKAQVVDF